MTDNRTTDLLPCPFCGGAAKVHKYCDKCSVEIDFKCAHDVSPNAKCLINEGVFWVEHECSPISDEEVRLSTYCYVSAREAIAEWNAWVMPQIKTCTMSIDKSKIDNDEVESLVCSMCGYETFRQYTFGNEGEFISYPEPNYCPHCGARVMH